jgi:hypothetical protein
MDVKPKPNNMGVKSIINVLEITLRVCDLLSSCWASPIVKAAVDFLSASPMGGGGGRGSGGGGGGSGEGAGKGGSCSGTVKSGFEQLNESFAQVVGERASATRANGRSTSAAAGEVHMGQGNIL